MAAPNAPPSPCFRIKNQPTIFSISHACSG
jgi:hypothetical protein